MEVADRVNLIVETDGLLKNYIETVVLKEILSQRSEGAFKGLNSNQLHSTLILETIEPSTLKEFAATLRLSKSAASALVDRMVDNGFVLRQPNPQCRREILLTVSPEFKEHAVWIRGELSEWFATLIEEMGEETFAKWYEVMTSLNTIIKRRIRSNHV